MQIQLSERLQKVADLVIAGHPAADIGTDHAYLPVYLVINGICPAVVASDRVRGPLASATQLVDLLSLDKQIHIRLGDGLKVLKPGEATTVCIAGMGGNTIRDILGQSPGVLAQTQRLVLQPQSNVAVVRRYLMENGWRLVAEEIAVDSGFYYEIMAAEKGSMELSPDEIEFGPLLLSQPHPLLAPFLQLKRADLESLMQGLSTNPGPSVRLRLQELAAAARRIDELLARLPQA